MSRPIPGSAEDWLVRAGADLALAKVSLPPGALYEDLCFHAQQSAEKSLKAVYQHNGWTFRYVHDLKALLSGLSEKGLVIPDEVEESISLTTYAQEFRYPGVGEPVTQPEYERAVVLAEQVLRWAQSEIAKSKARGGGEAGSP